MSDKGKEMSVWADQAMFEAAPMARDERGEVTPQVHVLWATPDPLGAIAAACRMYEGKPTYNLTDITDDERRHYWEEVQKTHLKAPLEFVKIHFFIEGVTRSFTHQMVRQRTAVYAQESLRFAVKEGFASEVPLPPSLMGLPDDDFRVQMWRQTITQIEDKYTSLVNAGMPQEDARGLLPHQITTRLNYCTDLRALLDHAGNRLCTQAQFEWRAVFLDLLKSLAGYRPPINLPDKIDIKVEPIKNAQGDVIDERLYVSESLVSKGSTKWQFAHILESKVFKPVCLSLGHCPFTAGFDRQCTIRERVQKGQFNLIDPAEWMADPTAGRRD